MRPSMGSVGDAYDNAMCESFFATLECELLDRRRFASLAEAQDGLLQLHRGLVQSRPAAFGIGLSVTHGLRNRQGAHHHGTVITQARRHSTKAGQLQCSGLACASMCRRNSS